jgi:hypothetical protein
MTQVCGFAIVYSALPFSASHLSQTNVTIEFTFLWNAQFALIDPIWPKAHISFVGRSIILAEICREPPFLLFEQLRHPNEG